LDNLSKNSQHVDQLLVNMQPTPFKVNATLDNASRQITTLSDTIKVLSGNLNNTLALLKPTLQNFKMLSDSLHSLELGRTLKKTEQAIGKLNETLGRLSKGDNTMSKLMTEDTLYVNLNKLLIDLDSLSNHLNAYPKHFFAPLGKSHKKIARELEEAEKKK
jgi:phospholipid/cholesterol/gamma-HCH transport system substrate-binding protein